MISDTEQSRLREKFNPDGSLLRRHQLRMLEMLKYIDWVCKKHNIKYWLCSGTLIGAVRHGGFIPWDDDVDIEMLSEDYKKFVKVMEKEPQVDYVLQTHKTDKDYFAPYGKLRDLHSEIKENHSNDLYYKYHGCYIDIFVIEPSSSYFLSYLSGLLWIYLLGVPNKRLGNGVLRQIYYPFAYFSIFHVAYPIMRRLSKWMSNGQYRLVLGSCFYKPRRIEDIFPLCTASFENISFPIPQNADCYLKRIYGDYMCLPDIGKIECHTTKVEIFNEK